MISVLLVLSLPSLLALAAGNDSSVIAPIDNGSFSLEKTSNISNTTQIELNQSILINNKENITLNTSLPEAPQNGTDTLILSLPEESPAVPQTTILNIITNKIKAFIGEIINIQTVLTYDNNTPVAGKKVDFYTEEFIGSQTTDEDGKANLLWNTSSLPTSHQSILAVYEGDNASVASSS